MNNPILIHAGDKTLLINGSPPMVDCRVVAEEEYQKLIIQSAADQWRADIMALTPTIQVGDKRIDHKRQAEALVILLDGAVQNEALPEVWCQIEAAMVRLANTIAPEDPSTEGE